MLGTFPAQTASSPMPDDFASKGYQGKNRISSTISPIQLSEFIFAATKSTDLGHKL
jgi:hypothetical protein